MPPDSHDAPAPIASRKAEHIALCETDDVAFRAQTNLLDEVQLVHDALPELALEDIDLSVSFCGKTLKAPLIIAAMTGGTAQAEGINRSLAALAQRHGLGFGFGSQRPLLSGVTEGYAVRDVAPDALILGNLGLVQARETSTAAIERLLTTCGADALCVHLNPAMEVIQPGGDVDFRDGLKTIARLVQELTVPVVVKETGCGLSREVGRRLVDVGVRWVDTSGAGGTSWVGVETLRAKADQRALGERFWDWGIPTAASVAQLADLGLGICATGGVADGLAAAHAVALGATAAGVARPFLQALAQGGPEGLERRVKQVIDELRFAHFLSGARTPAELQTKPILIGSRLARWIPKMSPLRDRAML